MAGINIGIFAHVDAGKTTLSEQMLLQTGTIRQAGSVDRGTAHTDGLPVERRRGISVKAACAAMQWKGTELRLIDTPGHIDFSAEIERSMWALDAAVLAVDACQGVQPQTETLYRALKEQGLPFLLFLNKTDREGADPEKTMEQVRRRLGTETAALWDEDETEEYVCGTDDGLTARYLEGETIRREEITAQLARMTREGKVHPALKGSAMTGEGVGALMDAIVTLLPEADDGGEELCGVAFAEARDRTMGRGLWVRLFSGKMSNRMAVELAAGTDRRTGAVRTVQRKITQIRDAAGRDTGTLQAGGTGVLFGLGDTEIGTVFGREELLPRKVQPGLLRTPLITVQVKAEDPEDAPSLREACRELSLEDPLLQVRYEKSTGEMHMQMMGKVQMEILQEELETRFGLKVRFGEPTVIYRETIRQRATGFVAYTMPKPCWAVLEFDIEPGERGSGVSYTSTVAGKDILPRYQHQVEQALPQALSQGRMGWQVTDVRITLTGGNHHLIHTHPLDFIVATPMGIQDGLKRGGSVLLEPILEARFVMPAETMGRVISDVQMMRGEVTDTGSDGETAAVTALIPASESMDYPTAFASLTGGRGSMSTRLHSWRDCPTELGATAPGEEWIPWIPQNTFWRHAALWKEISMTEKRQGREELSRIRMLMGEAAMERLQASRVAVFGIGGVGGFAAEALVRSGIGAIDLIDHDRVSLSNLNRQIIATRSTVGRMKTEAARERMEEIRPECRVTVHPVFFLPEAQDQFDFSAFDYVVDAIDTVAGKLALISAARSAGTPVISAMGAGNKTDPTALRVAEIEDTSVCPLARIMRSECRKRGIRHLKVVYSTEMPIRPEADEAADAERQPGRRTVPGSAIFVPAAMGMAIAAEVVRDLARRGGKNDP